MFSIYSHQVLHKRFLYKAIYIIPLFCLLAGFFSCKKNDFAGGNPSVLQVYNAMDDGLNLYINLSDKRPAQFATNGYLGNQGYSVQNNTFTFSELSTKVEFYSREDTFSHDKPLISTSLETIPGASYLMLLFGTKSDPDFTLVKDEFPSIIVSDSSVYIRFSNISEANPVSVNIKGQAPGSLVQQLPFRSTSEFKTIKVDRSLPDYEFEIRDQASGVLISSYTLTGINSDIIFSLNMIFQPYTLVLSGKAGASSPNEQKITEIKHRAS
ncbi:hypothetical protein [Pseudobacter ginsenosidimutans]|uniref:DUF4397 domain-containing protein n=1 Tax=Pseudobacter ginsenosidimutans TaxID=661488 RepID=A0A4Q7N513_9BACT|nr:hypothetical protein [Pseudobacter ginsenosidimutans]QEC44635.1 hypothetical protein FSB84_24230 [Pseudobacter ginsenosidimutans]RZS76116.1 hypothetical protein EV199_1994 [Pseudobacter ginsenosidimutans]